MFGIICVAIGAILIIVGITTAIYFMRVKFEIAKTDKEIQKIREDEDRSSFRFHSMLDDLTKYRKGLRKNLKVHTTIIIVAPILALIFAIPPFFTMVPAKSVGIYVSFGKPIKAVGHGLHTKAPWVSVQDMDGTIQNSIYSGDSKIPVRLGSTASADLDVSVQWRLKTEGAMDVYMNYRPTDGQKPLDVVQSNVIDRNLRSSLNAAFGSYDPLSTEAMNDGVGVGTELKSFEQVIKDDLIANSGDQVEIISVTLTNIDFDGDTDQRIAEYQAELAKTRNAEQAKKTAEQMAEANRILTESLSDQVNTANCLAIIEKTNQSPLGCFPNAPVTPVTNVN